MNCFACIRDISRHTLLRSSLAANVNSCAGYLFYVLLPALLCLHCVQTFNIDTEYPLVFGGPPASYFGYSVSLLANSQGSWLVAGAPRANSTYVAHENIVEPGVIFKCTVQNRTCTSILLDRTGNGQNVIITKDQKYRGIMDGMWLGVSMDTTTAENGRLVACAHRWRNEYYRGHHLMNGLCYSIDNEFDERSLQKLIPLVSGSQQILKTEEYKYAVGQTGISAQFVKDSDSLLLGAPGISDWKGSVALLTRADSGVISKRSVSLQSYATRLVPSPANMVEYGSYLGYSITSGSFHENGDIRYVIGAPRHKYKGTVFIINIVDDRSEGRFESKIEKHGEQMGEYFGSSVLATDVTNDGLDDLLVGAPLHSTDMDEGKVYVYINKGSARLLLSNEGLAGSRIRGSRFGTSMAIIGDVNMDGFQDVAIGAPFENGKGAVYIYHGSSTGLKSHFQQRILAQEGSASARGFGVSISRGMDVDGNNYPDLAIGAFHSDEAFIFRSRPLVYLKGSLSPDPAQINMDKQECNIKGTPTSCYNLEACVTYTGNFTPSALRVNIRLEMDTLKMSRANMSRVMIRMPNGDEKTSALVFEQTLQATESWCQNYEIHALGHPRDIMTPIQMKLRYELIPGIRTNVFCPTCPLIDKSQPNMAMSQMRYLKHCGDDDKCDSDLRLTAELKNYKAGDVLIIGSRSKLVLHMEVSNKMEPAYATVISLDVPPWMDIDQRPPACEFTLENRHTLQCTLANPLKANSKATLDLNLNLQRLPVKDANVVLNISTTSDSNEDEIKRLDNRVIITVPVKVMADVFVFGIAMNEQIFYDHDDKGNVDERATANFSHIYEVVNLGPSPVNMVTVQLHYPTRSRDGQVHFLDVTGLDKRDGSRGAVFGTCEGKLGGANQHVGTELEGESLIPIDDTTSSPNTLPSRRRKRDVANEQAAIIDPWSDENNTRVDEVRQESMAVDCKTMTCEMISCTVGPFDMGISVALTIHASVHVHNLRSLMGKKDVANIFTMARIYVNSSSDVQPANNKADIATVSSELKPGGPPLPRKLAPWIIPVSIVGGFLLLVLIVYGMVKAGFFRRETKEQMERLMHGEQDSSQDNN